MKPRLVVIFLSQFKLYPGEHFSQATHAPGCVPTLLMPVGHALQPPAESAPQNVRYEPGGHASHAVHVVFHSPGVVLKKPLSHSAHEPPK